MARERSGPRDAVTSLQVAPMMYLLLAGLGGFLGATCRYGLTGLVQRVAGSPFFPWGTLAVNVLGCLLIGLLAGLGEVRGPFSPEARVLLLAGVLGGFTTFSAFGYESVQLLRTGYPGLALANVAAQLLLGFAAVGCGLLLGRHL